MQRSYDVVVIGGGVIGLMTAIQLRLLGAGSVALLERRHLGAGESGKSSALVRQHDAHPRLLQAAGASRTEWASFHERIGRDIGFRQPGMLFLVAADQRPAIETTVRLQQSAGIGVTRLDADELRALEPRGRFEEVAAAWEPGAGSVDPVRAIGACGAEATRLGVDIQLGCEVLSIVRDAGEPDQRVTGVETTAGRVATRQIVAATGPWSPRLLAALGAELPLDVVSSRYAFLRPPVDLGDEHPVLADSPQDALYKPETGATRVGLGAPERGQGIDPDAPDEGISNELLQEARARAERRFPAYSRAVVWGGGSGLCTTTPDGQPAIGPLAGLEGLVLATGFCGRAFQLAPAVGRGVAELIVNGTTRHLDLDCVDPARFRRQSAHVSVPRTQLLD